MSLPIAGDPDASTLPWREDDARPGAQPRAPKGAGETGEGLGEREVELLRDQRARDPADRGRHQNAAGQPPRLVLREQACRADALPDSLPVASTPSTNPRR